jgi:predicted transcriptional regulator
MHCSREDIDEAISDLVEAGILRSSRMRPDKNGLLHPVYEVVPEAELSDTAKDRLNTMKKNQPN